MAVPSILEHKPVAMELLDRGSILEGWSGGDSGDSNACIMFVEFYGNDNSIYDKVSNFEHAMRDRVKILESGYNQKSVDRAWNERRNSLNSAMKKGMGSRKPAGIIEDTVVHPDILYYYLIFLLKALAKYNLDYVVYGHAGNGNLHLRPFMDLSSSRSNSLMHRRLRPLRAVGDGCLAELRRRYGEVITITADKLFPFTDPSRWAGNCDAAKADDAGDDPRHGVRPAQRRRPRAERPSSRSRTTP